MLKRFVSPVASLLLFGVSLAAQSPVTGVLTTLTIKSDVDHAQVTKILPDEVRVTVRMYLDGKIQQWYARSDGKGVVFVMACKSVEEAKSLTDTLPLAKANLANFEYTALSPLTPLRLLVSEPASSSPKP